MKKRFFIDGMEFIHLSEAKLFVRDMCELNDPQTLIIKEEGEPDQTKILVKKKKVDVCRLCRCIRRESNNTIMYDSPDRSEGVMVEFFGEEKTCSDPICKEFRSLTPEEREAYDDVEDWMESLNRTGSTSDFDILNKLRFYGEDPSWLIRN